MTEDSTTQAITPIFLDQLNETLLVEMQSYLTLNEIGASVRRVSKTFQQSSEQYKAIHLKYLQQKNAVVEIMGLQSALGQTLNSKIGTIISKRNEQNGRFTIQIVNPITGETSKQNVKPKNCNIYPCASSLLKQKFIEEELKYTNNAKVRAEHGMLLVECLTLARFATNVINGYSYFPNDYDQFHNLPQQHPSVAQCNASMWTFYSIEPSITGRHADMSVLDSTVNSLIQCQKELIDQLGSKTKWKADGENGELIVRNYVRFMRSWEAERISGEFWVTSVVKTGTLMVKINSGGVLGDVYLVKGLASVIGELCPRLPTKCRATFLPLYNFLIYDGIMVGMPPTPVAGACSGMSPLKHAQTAIANETVIKQGKSSKEGLWDSPPPPLPRVVGENKPLDWTVCHVNDNSNNEVEKENPNEEVITETQKKEAIRLAKLVKKTGGIKYPCSGKNLSKSIMTLRRFGYTKEENPGKIASFLREGSQLHMFQFKGELTYTLDEILCELQVIVKNQGMMGVIMIDELSIVDRLHTLLKKCFEEEGIKGELRVKWYPPPSEEESKFTDMTMYGGGRV
jgi:hypothetical protein